MRTERKVRRVRKVRKARTGAQGAKGLTWRADWSSATNYVIDDAVQFGGKAYVALQAGTNQQPGERADLLVIARGRVELA